MGVELKAREVCWATAPAVRVRELRAELREQARRGEIMVIGQGRVSRGQCEVPYVRLAPDTSRTRGRHRIALWAGAAGVYGLTAAALIWEARFLLLQGVGLVLAAASAWWVLTRISHSGACPGLHCDGCKG